MAWQQSSSPSHLRTPQKQLKLSTITPEFSSPASPAFSSPLSSVQARRRSQYKSHSPSTSRSSSNVKRKPSILFTNQSEKDRARQRFQEACLDRAVKARNSAVKRKRHLESSPGGEDAMDDDAEDMDDDIMRDEFFRRIVAHSNRQTRYNYVLSFDREVGSPINPDLEDVTKWERELHG
ncbi:hypothetical protein CPB85DRAFT_347153 [Mucidula mucida]|nr:hypothetical protein CPB85DRAFT_347153 [Mucidula mucida]